MADKKIPGPVWIIVGAGIVLMSAFIDIEKLGFFIFVGAIFIVIGFMKIMMKEKKSALQMHTDSERRMAAQHSQHAQHAAHVQPQHAAHAQHAQHPLHAQGVHHTAQQHPESAQHHQSTTRVVRCANCGVKLHPLFKFCPNCGQKL